MGNYISNFVVKKMVTILVLLFRLRFRQHMNRGHFRFRDHKFRRASLGRRFLHGVKPCTK